MRTTRLLVSVLLLAVMAVAGVATQGSLLKEAQELFQPIPDKPPALPDNKMTPEQIELGTMLYFEPRLSKSGIITCNTCHAIGTGGADNVSTSVGHGWQKGPRNAPTVLNAVFNTAQFWDGRAKDLEEQAKGPVQASVEMNSTPDHVVKTLSSIPEYVERFRKAFPGQQDPVTFDNMAAAIEAFEATLITPNAPFDRYLKGDAAALDAEQQAGLRLFIAKGCGACHEGLNLGGDHYHPFGVVKKPGADILPVNDKGRFQVTKTATDEYVFRAAPLRNVALTAPYFHSGEVWNLKQAVAVMGDSQLGQTLTDEEAEQIAGFLRTLTGTQPRVVYPILPPSTDKTPRPQAE
jgi:cytochrome c peroxidase